MISDYTRAVEYLYTNLPIFHRIGRAALKNDLSNTLILCERLGNPQHAFKSIHIAGTNGKGSTSHMIAAVLHQAGYRTGLYTSPHLKSFTERIRINGIEVSEAFVIQFVDRVKSLIDEIKPSFFEVTVAMAFDYFATSGVDVVVVETGMGGRLDSTNIIDPLLSVITNIGMDHYDILGPSLKDIAYQKAGIIKPYVPVVIGEYQESIADIFLDEARKKEAPIVFADQECHISQNNLELVITGKEEHIRFLPDLQGTYQRQNCRCVYQAVCALRKLGFDIGAEHLKLGMESVVSLTGLKGRWQCLSTKPLVICDVGHNIEAFQYLIPQIESQQYRHLHLVLGFVRDKDVLGILSLFPKSASYYFCQPAIPRAMEIQELGALGASLGLDSVCVKEVNQAINRAKENCSDQDMIFIGGSTFVVAEINEL